MRARRNLLFGGPTLHRAMAMGTPRLDDVILLPPVRRGDVERIVRTSGPNLGVMIIVDGFFHLKTLAVGHAEIRDAIRRGWVVWGLSSMGAIRACELRHLGMRGFGECFEAYVADPDLRDDEVSLLHEPDPPYREASEPLLHMRRAIAALVDDGAVTAADAATVLDRLMAMWFGERTLATLGRLLCERAPGHAAHIRDTLRVFDRFRIKATDLLRFLDERRYES